MSDSNPVEVLIRLAPEMPPEITAVDENGAGRAWFTRLEDLVAVFRAEYRPTLRWLPERLVATDLERGSVWFRPAGVTQLWLAVPEKTTLLTIPMPPLVLAFRYSGALAVMALGENVRPSSDARLYHAPLPNLGLAGGVCLGSTAVGDFDPLEEAVPWDAFWGSAFSGHQVAGKSRRYPEDVRLLLLELDGKETFPIDDLAPAGLALSDWLAHLSGQGAQR